MTSKEVRDALNEYLRLKTQVNIKKSILDSARQDYDTLKGISYTNEPVQGGQKDSVVERAVCRVLRIEGEYMEACERLFIAENIITDMMQYLNAGEQELVIDRYMNGVNDFYKLSRKYYYTVGSIKYKFNVIFKKIASAN